MADDHILAVMNTIADVDCRHRRAYAMCATCAAEAVRPALERLTAERDALKAAIPDALQIAQYAKTYASGEIWEAACRLLPVLAALDAPETPGADDTHVDRHGREWDPHPFVQTRRVCREVCVCGQPLEHGIHAPETPEETDRG